MLKCLILEDYLDGHDNTTYIIFKVASAELFVDDNLVGLDHSLKLVFLTYIVVTNGYIQRILPYCLQYRTFGSVD